MELGGLRTNHEPVFLLSPTHDAVTHSLAAPMAVMDTYADESIADRLHALGDCLAAGVWESAADMGVSEHVLVRGRACNLVFATLDADGKPSQPFRTLFLRQLLAGGVIGPSFVVSAALSDDDIDRTVEVVGLACAVYRQALEADDPTPWLGRRW